MNSNKSFRKNRRTLRRILSALCAIAILLTIISPPGIARADNNSSAAVGSENESSDDRLSFADNFESDDTDSTAAQNTDTAGIVDSGTQSDTTAADPSSVDSAGVNTEDANTGNASDAVNGGEVSDTNGVNSSSDTQEKSWSDSVLLDRDGNVVDAENAYADATYLLVKAEADEGVITDGAELEVVPITAADSQTSASYDALGTKLAQTADDREQSLLTYLGYEVRLVMTRVDGEKIAVNPQNGDVRLTFLWVKGSDAAQAEDADSDPIADDNAETFNSYYAAANPNGAESALPSGKNDESGADFDLTKISSAAEVSVVRVNASESEDGNLSNAAGDALRDVPDAASIQDASVTDLTENQRQNPNGDNIASVQTDEDHRLESADIKADSLSIFAFAWTEDGKNTEKSGISSESAEKVNASSDAAASSSSADVTAEEASEEASKGAGITEGKKGAQGSTPLQAVSVKGDKNSDGQESGDQTGSSRSSAGIFTPVVNLAKRIASGIRSFFMGSDNAGGLAVDGESVSSSSVVSPDAKEQETEGQQEAAVNFDPANTPVLNVHYVDENGNELGSVQTIRSGELSGITDGVSTSALATETFDGYTFKEARMSNAAGKQAGYLKLSADGSSLQYKAGGDLDDTNLWVAVSGQDVADIYLVYENGKTATLEADSQDGKYHVTVSYNQEDMKEAASLAVTPLSEDDSQYKSARQAVIDADNDYDDDNLGMQALDITIKDKNGDKVEPDENSKVSVSITMNELPEGLTEDTNVEVQHITDTLSLGEKIVNKLQGKSTEEATTVAEGNSSDELNFEVSGFSVFTITWTKGDGTRLGNVVLHYVKDTGLEKDVESELISDADLSKYIGTPVDLTSASSPWQKTLKSDTDGTTYTFDRAVLGDRLSGPTITGVKIDQSTETRSVQTGYEGDYPNGHYTYTDVPVTIYRLYYTTDATVNTSNGTANNWTLYTDTKSGNSGNNADIFMIYKTAAKVPITFHFIDRKGNPVADNDGKNSMTVDASTWGDAWKNGVGFGPRIFGYEKDLSSENNMGDGHIVIVPKDNSGTMTYDSGHEHDTYAKTFENIKGDAYRWIRYKSYNGTAKFWVGDGGTNPSDYYSTNAPQGTNDSWNNGWYVIPTKDFDAYIVYVPSETVNITIHHVDANGNKLAEDTTSSNISSNGTFSASDNKTNIDGYTYQDAHLDSASGEKFTQITYSKGDYAWTSAVKNEESDVTTSGIVKEVWLVYTPAQSTPVNVHYVDESGNELRNATTVKKTSGSTLTPGDGSIAKTIAGYSATGSAYYMNGDTKQPFASLSYSLDGDTWSTKYKTSSDDEEMDTTPSLVSNVYLSYTRNDGTVLFHHVDSTGTKLHEDTSVEVSDTSTNGYGNRWNGFADITGRSATSTDAIKRSGLGDWQMTVIGDFNTETDMVINTTNGYGLFYKYDSAGTWQTGTGRTMSSPSITRDGRIKDVYNIYGNKGVVVHHVDENGNTLLDDTYASIASGSTFNYLQQSSDDIRGYSVQSAHVGSYNGAQFTDITYTNNGDSWTSSVQNNGSVVETDNNPVNEVWLIYSTGAITKSLTVHYHYMESTGSSDEAYYRDGTAKKSTDILKITSAGETQLVRHRGDSSYIYEDIVRDGKVKRTVKTGEKGDSNGDMPLSFSNVRLGSANGPSVTSVEVNSSGQIIYHTEFDGGMTPNTSTNEWTYTQTDGTQNGRRFVITEDASGNPTLQDSQNGTFVLNYANEAGGGESGTDTHQSATYVAAYHGDKMTTEYTVTYTPAHTDSNGNYVVNTYRLHVEDSMPSKNTDLYYNYVDGGQDDALWINNDILYSGLFRVRISDALQDTLNGYYDSSTKTTHPAAHNIQYTWHQVKVPRGTTYTKSSIATNPGTEVTRKQTGQHWNIAANKENSTYLDIEADEGDETWGYGTDVYYYVTLDYATGGTSTTAENGTVTWTGDDKHSITSDPLMVGYYGQLENGDFERPTYNRPINQVTNAAYAQDGGIWQSTGIGSESGATNVSIETINTTAKGNDSKDFQNSYKWFSSGSDIRYKKDANGNQTTERQYAVDGDQFAELNCSAAGALYQDVITHPNESLNYWFSHRARGEKQDSTPEYDTMYLVIMPTKLAMTSGDNGGELKTQADLIQFVKDHGTFSNQKATSEEDEVIYSNVDDGILIRKVSSDDQNWHSILSQNGYIAKGGLTRFFFMAGPTSWNGESGSDSAVEGATHGNFLDAVGFSQTLPEPDGFSMVVTKTFSGLTQAQVADLAASKTENDTITTNANPFTFTITDSYTNSGSTSYNNALNYAKLQFTATKTGTNQYKFTPTAVQNKDSSGNPVESGGTVSDLLTETDSNGNLKNTVSANTNSDGSVTMVWTFTDQSLPSDVSDQSFNYTVREINNMVDGYTDTATYTATTGHTFTQAMAANISGTTVNAGALDGTNGLTSVTQGTAYELRNSENLVIAQVTNGSKTGYLVWTSGSELTQEQRSAVVDFINNSERHWARTAVASSTAGYSDEGHVTWVNGTGSDGFNYDPTNVNLKMTYASTSEGHSYPTVTFQNSATQQGTEASGYIRQKFIGRYTFNNSYAQRTTPQITVQKVFTGVTRTTVDDLLRNGYQITLTKTQNDSGASIASAPSMVLNAQTPNKYSNVTYSSVTDETNGKITLTWTIREVADTSSASNGDIWIGGPGTYSVKEEHYSPTALHNGDNNVLQYITVNDQYFSAPESSEFTQDNIHVGKVGITDYSPMINAAEGDKTKTESSVTSGTSIAIPAGTNLVIGKTSQYYVVWTSQTPGVNLRQAILKQIQSVFKDSNVNLGEITFNSGDNPGKIQYDATHSGTTMNISNNTLTFNNENERTDSVTRVTWSGYYYTTYSLENGTDGSGNNPMQTNDTEIRIANSYDPLVKIKKISSATDNPPLGGAKFRLYKKESGGNKLYYLTTSTPTDPKFGAVSDVSSDTADTRVGDIKERANEIKALSFISSSEDGIVTIGALTRDKDTNGKHQNTIYYLEEYEAPAGYNKIDDIAFRVKDDGTVQLVGPNDKTTKETTYVASTDVAGISWEDPYYQIQVNNTPGYALPETGGPGVWRFIMIGLAFIAVSGTWLYLRRKRRSFRLR